MNHWGYGEHRSRGIVIHIEEVMRDLEIEEIVLLVEWIMRDIEVEYIILITEVLLIWDGEVMELEEDKTVLVLGNQ